jgi:hypothetical protein
MKNPLSIAPPPPRPVVIEPEPKPESEPQPVAPAAPLAAERKPAPTPPTARRKAAAPSAAKFRQIKEDERVQFNKRVARQVADGFEMLAIRTRIKVPELLAEALEMLEERYGKVG